MEKLKLLHIFSSSNPGGLEKKGWIAIGAMNSLAYSNDVIFLEGANIMVPFYQKIANRVLSLTKFNFYQKFLRVTQELDNGCYDVIFTYGIRAGFLFHLIYMTNEKHKNTGHVIGLRADYSAAPFRRWMHAYLSFHADLVLSNSQAALDLFACYNYSIASSMVADDGIDVALFSTNHDQATLRARLELPIDKKIIICVAHFHPQKRHSFLLRAFSRTIKRFPNTLLILVGDGPLSDSIRRYAKQLNLEQHVKFIGLQTKQTAIADLLNASDIFVLSSSFEGLPGAIMEAMACSLPVVTTHVGGVSQLVVHGVTGYLADASSESELACGLNFYLQSPTLAKKAGQAGKKRVCERFTIKKMAQGWENAAQFAFTKKQKKLSSHIYQSFSSLITV
ncbi:glycosyltransferase family 4 protein [Pajaroellobacter abortibovis]|uniref:Glycosyl transferase family 1 domain-containing protein n=1 Tax=Pajaroellobacter abortibovis TaxID=1882918 RepID=A0A1L6MZ42_9BACT|nr:glycosyltransferase family 4 protein [Pajaroellobacter abortibovis]APS00759.1 hypothetical protein BCY86_08760 [Pajaroellobacter abortibovis]